MKLDKLLHLLVGALIAAYVLPEGWLIAMLCVSIVAWGKEGYDWWTGRGAFELWDVVATKAGGLATLAYFWLDPLQYLS